MPTGPSIVEKFRFDPFLCPGLMTFYNIKRIAWVAAGIHVACSCLPILLILFLYVRISALIKVFFTFKGYVTKNTSDGQY